MIRTLPLLAGLLLLAPPVFAAQSYDNCTGYIDALPATISTRGTWCLRKNLGATLTTGQAITITADHVTVDCNHHKLGGLGGGTGTLALGIASTSARNVTIRQCNIRGFRTGVSLGGVAGGHLVEDNRFDANTYMGIAVRGRGSVVQRNLLLASGGATGPQAGQAYGIAVQDGVDVLDNTIAGVLPGPNAAGNGNAVGLLLATNRGGTVADNRIRGVVAVGAAGTAIGLHATSGQLQNIRGNELTGDGQVASKALVCATGDVMTRSNVVLNYKALMHGCKDKGNNRFVASP